MSQYMNKLNIFFVNHHPAFAVKSYLVFNVHTNSIYIAENVDIKIRKIWDSVYGRLRQIFNTNQKKLRKGTKTCSKQRRSFSVCLFIEYLSNHTIINKLENAFPSSRCFILINVKLALLNTTFNFLVR